MCRHLLFTSLIALASCSPQASIPDRIYVSNERDDSVVALDPKTGAVVQRISAGKRPRGLAISIDGTRLYVAVSGSPIGGPNVDESKLPPPDHDSDGIAVINLANGKVERVLSAGTDPETFALSPDGNTLFVSNEDKGMVSAVATNGKRAPRSVKVGEEPEGIAVTPDGARLFVACEASDYVAMLNAHTLEPIKQIAIEGRPRSVLMSADGTRVYVSVEIGGKLAVISAADGALIRQIDLAKGDKTQKPMGIVETGERHLFITTGRGGAVIEVDPQTGTILRRIDEVGARPWGIGLTTDHRLLVTANGPSNDISMLDAASGKVVRKVQIGNGPWGVATRAGAKAQ